ncbi:hypothetical protein [uncultured Nitratireductor sp.]|uniref:hypothetical protein n=1 Tax=uncultured Nitratireductor sp. TaxID=520953 RepID=UPI0025DE4E8E|nr:hypothetical protein [uncultured Nitratireductor sp.]
MHKVLTFLLLIGFVVAGSLPAVKAVASDGMSDVATQAEDEARMRCCAGTENGNAYASSGCVMDCHYLAPLDTPLIHPRLAPLTEPSVFSPHRPVISGLFRPPIVS